MEPSSIMISGMICFKLVVSCEEARVFALISAIKRSKGELLHSGGDLLLQKIAEHQEKGYFLMACQVQYSICLKVRSCFVEFASKGFFS